MGMELHEIPSAREFVLGGETPEHRMHLANILLVMQEQAWYNISIIIPVFPLSQGLYLKVKLSKANKILLLLASRCPEDQEGHRISDVMPPIINCMVFVV